MSQAHSMSELHKANQCQIFIFHRIVLRHAQLIPPHLHHNNNAGIQVPSQPST